MSRPIETLPDVDNSADVRPQRKTGAGLAKMFGFLSGAGTIRVFRDTSFEKISVTKPDESIKGLAAAEPNDSTTLEVPSVARGFLVPPATLDREPECSRHCGQ